MRVLSAAVRESELFSPAQGFDSERIINLRYPTCRNALQKSNGAGRGQRMSPCIQTNRMTEKVCTSKESKVIKCRTVLPVGVRVIFVGDCWESQTRIQEAVDSQREGQVTGVLVCCDPQTREQFRKSLFCPKMTCRLKSWSWRRLRFSRLQLFFSSSQNLIFSFCLCV